MRIITGHICKECCYCLEDDDTFGICCKDNRYKSISINQQAPTCFCGDGEEITYYHTIKPIDNEMVKDFDFYD